MGWDLITKEERQLGLEPSKYTKDPWNPKDFIGWSKGTAISSQDARPFSKRVKAMLGVKDVEALNSEAIRIFNEQAKALGGSSLTQEEYDELLKRKMMGF